MPEASTITERLRFLQIDDSTRRALRDFRPVAEPRMQSILGRFYDRIRLYPPLMAMFGNEAKISQASTAQAAHWLALLGGDFDDGYVERARRIGKAHEQIGLEPRWYIGAYALAMTELTALAVQHYRKKPDNLTACLQALVRAVFLDMDYAISVYIDEGKLTFGRKLDKLAADFEGSVQTVVEDVTRAAESCKAAAQSMAGTASESSQRATTVAAASEEASVNVQAVASATEELSASVREIGRQVTRSVQITGQAVAETARTDSSVQGLNDATDKIGEVVKLIANIAGQTNLLALNATIEAARAGEAGKGFAVVASEVKSLANRTAKATEEIAGQIKAIQDATKGAVLAIRSITGTISQIDEVTTAMASALEQQGSATQEIATNIQQASLGTSEVSSNIASMSRTAVVTGEIAEGVLAASRDLAGQSGKLSAQVRTFVAQIRAA